MENSEIAGAIINRIYSESQKVINMNITNMNETGIATILTSLTAFFVVDFRNEMDLHGELTSAFQRRIATSVSKDEYANYLYLLNDCFVKFRESEANYQYKTDNWVSLMMDEFAEMLLVMLRANATDYSRQLMRVEVNNLLEIARETGKRTYETPAPETLINKDNKLFDYDSDELKKPRWWQAILQVVVFVLSYEICAFIMSQLLYGLAALADNYKIFAFLLNGFGEMVVFTFIPAIVAMVVIVVFQLFFKKYYINNISAVICAMILSYIVISQLVSYISYNGLFSWTTVNYIWFDIILCGILFMFMYSKTDLKRKQNED